MSVKTQRRHARLAKRARHDALRAAARAPQQEVAHDQEENAAHTQARPSSGVADGPTTFSQREKGSQAQPAEAVHSDVQDALDAQDEQRPPRVPQAWRTPAYDARGAYVPLPFEVRTGMLEAVAEGLLPGDAARMYGLGHADFLGHLNGDADLGLDLERAELVAKLHHLKVIREAPSSERIRAARWFLKVRFPEEFDAVIVSRRARAALQAQFEAEAQALKEAAARAKLEAYRSPFAAEPQAEAVPPSPAARENARAPQASAASSAAQEASHATKAAAVPPSPSGRRVGGEGARGPQTSAPTVQSDGNRPRTQSVTAA